MNDEIVLNIYERVTSALIEDYYEVRLSLEEGCLGGTGLTLYGVQSEELRKAREADHSYQAALGMLQAKISEQNVTIRKLQCEIDIMRHEQQDEVGQEQEEQDE